jgi:calcineurin-like phosphoesterase family protein
MNISFTDESKVFFTSDPHFGHINVIRYCNRPWKDVDEMREALIVNWNQTVPEDGVVVCLGDMAMGKVRENLPVYKRLNGHKILIFGNHDRVYPSSSHKKRDETDWAKFYEDCGFSEGHLDAHLELQDGRVFYLNHIPYPNENPAHEADRSSYEAGKLIIPEDKGEPLITGHVHQSWRAMKSFKGTPMLNVGVDVWGYTPVPLSTVVSDPIFRLQVS